MIVEFEDIKLEVVQNYKPQNRHIYLRIKDGKLEINTFKILSETDIISFIKRNYTSIKKTLLKSEKPTNHQLHLFGKAYDFKIVEASKNSDIILCHENEKDILKVIDNVSLKLIGSYSLVILINDELYPHHKSINKFSFHLFQYIQINFNHFFVILA